MSCQLSAYPGIFQQVPQSYIQMLRVCWEDILCVQIPLWSSVQNKRGKRRAPERVRLIHLFAKAELKNPHIRCRFKIYAPPEDELMVMNDTFCVAKKEKNKRKNDSNEKATKWFWSKHGAQILQDKELKQKLKLKQEEEILQQKKFEEEQKRIEFENLKRRNYHHPLYRDHNTFDLLYNGQSVSLIRVMQGRKKPRRKFFEVNDYVLISDFVNLSTINPQNYEDFLLGEFILSEDFKNMDGTFDTIKHRLADGTSVGINLGAGEEILLMASRNSQILGGLIKEGDMCVLVLEGRNFLPGSAPTVLNEESRVVKSSYFLNNDEPLDMSQNSMKLTNYLQKEVAHAHDVESLERIRAQHASVRENFQMTMAKNSDEIMTLVAEINRVAAEVEKLESRSQVLDQEEHQFTQERQHLKVLSKKTLEEEMKNEMTRLNEEYNVRRDRVDEFIESFGIDALTMEINEDEMRLNQVMIQSKMIFFNLKISSYLQMRDSQKKSPPSLRRSSRNVVSSRVLRNSSTKNNLKRWNTSPWSSKKERTMKIYALCVIV
eukprot:TRINITY_DN5816_c0_g1_i11.p1 TRINITY_DN5816_c0_g1~~TRINITY_DN5816_c0_g1_i11.p1  ORF type:complete len:546 (-),score=51.93 TRINITY_DN5816_c0_g1_i11:316-1953(-)